MAKKRLSMRKIKEVLRLKHAGGLSIRAIARACSIGKETVREIFGVHYHVDHNGRLMRSMGWSSQKAQHWSVERDETAVQCWVKTKCPRVKKLRTDRRHSRLSRRKQLLDNASCAADLGTSRSGTIAPASD